MLLKMITIMTRIPVMVTMMTIAMNLVSQLRYLAVSIDEISLIAGI